VPCVQIEKDLERRIKDAKKEKKLDIAKGFVKYVIFPNDVTLRKPEKNMEEVEKYTRGRRKGR
jgi:hypothetical protein